MPEAHTTSAFRGTQRLGKQYSSQRASECPRALPSGELPAASFFPLEKQRAYAQIIMGAVCGDGNEHLATHAGN